MIIADQTLALPPSLFKVSFGPVVSLSLGAEGAGRMHREGGLQLRRGG